MLQTAGKVTTFVKGRYDAFVGGGIEFGRFTETYALEDLNLYTAKQFAYGKAHDEKDCCCLEIGNQIMGGDTEWKKQNNFIRF